MPLHEKLQILDGEIEIMDSYAHEWRILFFLKHDEEPEGVEVELTEEDVTNLIKLLTNIKTKMES